MLQPMQAQSWHPDLMRSDDETDHNDSAEFGDIEGGPARRCPSPWLWFVVEEVSCTAFRITRYLVPFGVIVLRLVWTPAT